MGEWLLGADVVVGRGGALLFSREITSNRRVMRIIGGMLACIRVLGKGDVSRALALWADGYTNARACAHMT